MRYTHHHMLWQSYCDLARDAAEQDDQESADTWAYEASLYGRAVVHYHAVLLEILTPPQVEIATALAERGLAEPGITPYRRYLRIALEA